MSSLDRSRKLFVRSVLAGTSTLATLMGAQSLALMDNQAFDVGEDVIELTAIPTLMSFPTAQPTLAVEDNPDPTAVRVVPNITIFRQAGALDSTDGASASITTDVNSGVAVSNNPINAILPPNPVEVQAPEPVVIVEQPVVVEQPAQAIQPPQPQPQAEPQQPQAEKKKKSKKSKSGSSK